MADEKQQEQQYDVVVVGATGFTGRLVADYLAKRQQEGLELKWALAGRNLEKVQEIQSKLQATYADVIVGIIEANTANDEEGTRNLVKSTKTVLSTVGPFTRLGSLLVQICAEEGTHYCDITGETNWVASMIEEHHQTAKDNGAIIINSCGYDCVPSDMGVYFLAKSVREKYGTELGLTRCFQTASGGMSGGTFNTILEVMELPMAEKKKMSNPFCLVSEENRPKKRNDLDQDQFKPQKEKDLGFWSTVSMFATGDSRVVRRSNEFVNDGEGYGSDFHYQERMKTKGAFKAFMIAIFMGLALILLQFGPIRSLAKKFGPKPGNGPSEHVMRTGWFKNLVIGEAGDSGEVAKAKVTGLEPGYYHTSIMISEAALCLAFDEHLIDGGVLTPASALGDKYLERLQDTGMNFELVE